MKRARDSARAIEEALIDAEKDELYQVLALLPSNCWLARLIREYLHELEQA